MTPAVAAYRLGCGLALGMLLGLVYGFFRPLGQRRRALADGLTMVAAVWIWLYLNFSVCRGDIRLGCFLALFLGATVWEATAGKALRLVFLAIWQILGRVFRFSLFPVKKFYETGKFCLHLRENGLQ